MSKEVELKNDLSYETQPITIECLNNIWSAGNLRCVKDYIKTKGKDIFIGYKVLGYNGIWWELGNSSGPFRPEDFGFTIVEEGDA